MEVRYQLRHSPAALDGQPGNSSQRVCPMRNRGPAAGGSGLRIVFVDDDGRPLACYGVFVQHDPFDVLLRRKFIHGPQQGLFHDGTQTAGARAALDGPLRNGGQRTRPNVELDAWVEEIPFAETRDYVKKVMSNYDRRSRQLKKYEEQQRAAGSGRLSEDAVAGR